VSFGSGTDGVNNRKNITGPHCDTYPRRHIGDVKSVSTGMELAQSLKLDCVGSSWALHTKHS